MELDDSSRRGVYAPSLAADGSTLAAYRAGGQFGLNCPATGGCTNSQAYPVSPELAALLDSRTDPNQSFNLSYSLDFPYYGSASRARSIRHSVPISSRSDCVAR